MANRKMQRDPYRKNYFLVFAFTVVLTVSLIVVMILATTLITSKVENEFSSRKSEVVEHNLVSFNDFFQNRIPEISFYQGYLDSAMASTYAEIVLKSYPFVERIQFFDVLLNNNIRTQYGFSADNLVIYPVGIYEFTLHQSGLVDSNGVYLLGLHDRRVVLDHRRRQHASVILDDFHHMAFKLASFLERVDTTQVVYGDELFRVFYSVNPGKISFMNIPRHEDLKIYKDLMANMNVHGTAYEQDMITFFINPNKIVLENPVPELYEHIEIRPLVYDHFDVDPDRLIAEAPLPGALADHKLFFSSSRSFLSSEINRRLFPVMGGILLIYLFLIMFAYLIYRNLYINKRMFKLQYDFINNLTHEFKTPLSVIKIAGNNIGKAKELPEQERQLYGRILDEESDKLNNLMNTLLSFTQIENKSFKLKKENVDLREFCKTIVAATNLKYNDLRLEWQVDLDQPLYTDPVLLGSVFQNLIDNAYKYSRPENRVLEIRIFRRRRQVVITFADRGIGIAKKELEHVFKKFYRVQSQYNQQGSVGLGLAFCRELVNFMGGTITAESELGKGTTFTIALPVD